MIHVKNRIEVSWRKESEISIRIKYIDSLVSKVLVHILYPLMEISWKLVGNWKTGASTNILVEQICDIPNFFMEPL